MIALQRRSEFAVFSWVKTSRLLRFLWYHYGFQRTTTLGTMADSDFFSIALGIGTKNRNGEWLEVYYPLPIFHPNEEIVTSLGLIAEYQGGNRFVEVDDDFLDAASNVLTDGKQHDVVRALMGSKQPRLITFLQSDEVLLSTPEAYLKLHLLSHRFMTPNSMNLDGIFGLLPNVAWTNKGAVDPEELFDRQLQARAAGETLEVSSVDKFPKMTNYVVPNGVRIAHSARVRLGAYIGEGTTVMHEGFVNFNAGTLGEGMIEGRLSQGVTVGNGTDLGGSASIPGTLSGGGTVVISIGEDCLISANAGSGIPLGDRCVVEAGLYITPGALIQVLDENRQQIEVVKARVLSGRSDMMFIRNSQSGQVECRINTKQVNLNEELHAHN
jgi:2,3,4,5-tetrahydropyridine-2-carboxylate N-succinyltransferase